MDNSIGAKTTWIFRVSKQRCMISVEMVRMDIGGFAHNFNGSELLWFVGGVGMVMNQVEHDGTYLLQLVDYEIPAP